MPLQQQPIAPYSVAQWLPSDQRILDEWMNELFHSIDVDSSYQEKKELLLSMYPVAENEEEASKAFQYSLTANHKALDLHPPVEELMNAILLDPIINSYFHQMFWQQQNNPSAKGVKIPCWQIAILLINKIMDTAPTFNKTGLVGVPINVIFNWPMATSAGHSAFLNQKVNAIFKNILNYWGNFLKTESSVYVLNDHPKHGWFGEDAMSLVPNFAEEFICNPEKPFYGFKSWDDFFTRRFRDHVRPIPDEDDDSIVVNPCEASPFKITTNVRKYDYFWIKAQPYSVAFILNNNPFNEQFIGGTIYQAFLSALNYHRWHSPVNGTIVDKETIDGTYYSQCNAIKHDPASPNMSQAYLAQVAARGVLYIQADNPHIGLMAFVAVGMAEISSIDITVKTGDRVKKGQQLGMFHYGGSTFLLMFRPEVNISFDLHGETPGLHSKNIKLNEVLGTVCSSFK